MPGRVLSVLALGVLGGCGGSAEGEPRDAGADRSVRADAAGDGPEGGGWRAPEPPWPRRLPDAERLGSVPPGMRRLRLLVHVHSPVSHDACDGAGWRNGDLDPDCLSDLREGLCLTRVDALLLTDHAPHLDRLSFEDAFLSQSGDEPAAGGGAVWWRCPDGHRVLVAVGSENGLMPVLLRRHPGEPDIGADALEALYDGVDSASVRAFRAAGALVLVNHTEGRPLAWLRERELDGIEIYNLHANVDPRKDTGPGRPRAALAWLLRFLQGNLRLTPDLSLLAFLAPNTNALAKWDALLAEGRRLLGVAGTDAHQNAFPRLMADGERGDSYRRMIRWFSNHVLVDAARFEVAPAAAVREGLESRRLLVAFEGLGSPVGAAFSARTPAGETVPIGGEAPVGSRLSLALPRLPDGHPAAPPPRVSLRLLRVEPEGAVEVARREDGTAVEYVAASPGVYRAEVWMEPLHAAPYVPDMAEQLVRPVPWVYTNPIWVVSETVRPSRAEPGR